MGGNHHFDTKRVVTSTTNTKKELGIFTTKKIQLEFFLTDGFFFGFLVVPNHKFTFWAIDTHQQVGMKVQLHGLPLLHPPLPLLAEIYHYEALALLFRLIYILHFSVQGNLTNEYFF